MEDRFDVAKDVLNRDNHGLPLIFGDRVFEDAAHVVLPTIRIEDEEDRYKVVGLVEGRLYTAVFTLRGSLPRYISVRRSNTSEQRSYRDPR